MNRIQQKWKVSKQPMDCSMNTVLLTQSFNDTKYLINPGSYESWYDIRHIAYASFVQWKALMRRISSCPLARLSSPSWRSASEVAWNFGECLTVWCVDEILNLETFKAHENWLETQLGSLSACKACVLHCLKVGWWHGWWVSGEGSSSTIVVWLSFLDALCAGERCGAHAVNPCISRRKLMGITFRE